MIDPQNRLVADVLETDWNAKLRVVNEAQEKYEKQKAKDLLVLDNKVQEDIMRISVDFPKLWKSEKTTMRERKRIMRLLIEDVSLLRTDHVDVLVRFRGGKLERLQIPLPLRAVDAFRTPQRVVETIDELLGEYTTDKIAEILNERKMRSGRDKKFTAKSVTDLCRTYSLKSRRARLEEKGYITLEEMSKGLNVSNNTVQIWKRQGMLKAHPYNCKKECLFEPPGEGFPTKQQGLPFSQRKQFQLFSAD